MAELEQMMMAEMAAEQQQISDQRQKMILSERAKYEAMIRQKIQRNLNADGLQGKTCSIYLKLASGGLILDVQRIEGEQLACSETIRAVRKSEPLPVSSDPEVFAQLKEIKLRLDIEN